MRLDSWFPLLIFGAIVLLAAAGGLLGVVSERRRRTTLAQIAEQMGLAFTEEAADLLAALDGLPLFSRGGARRISNLVHGDTDEVALRVFDYRYTTGSGKNAHTYRQTVVCFQSPELTLPQFELKPQSFLHGISKLFGYQDIDFPSHPKFSRSFLLRGTDEPAVRKLFTAALLSFCESRPQIHIEGQGQRLVFYRAAKRVKPEQFRELMAEGFAVYRQFQPLGSGVGPDLRT